MLSSKRGDLLPISSKSPDPRVGDRGECGEKVSRKRRSADKSRQNRVARVGHRPIQTGIINKSFGTRSSNRVDERLIAAVAFLFPFLSFPEIRRTNPFRSFTRRRAVMGTFQ